MTQPRLSSVFIPLGAVALAAAAYAWGRSVSTQNQGDAAVAAEQAERVAVLERAVKRLRAANRKATPPSIQALAVHSTNGATASDPARGDEEERHPLDGAEVREELHPDEAARRAHETRIRYFDELSHRIDTELVDGAWRHRTEAPLERLLSEHLGPNVKVSEATCASTFCRVTLSHPESPRLPSDKMFEFDLSRASLEVTEVLFDVRAEGTTTLYLKRGQAPATVRAAAEE